MTRVALVKYLIRPRATIDRIENTRGYRGIWHPLVVVDQVQITGVGLVKHDRLMIERIPCLNIGLLRA